MRLAPECQIHPFTAFHCLEEDTRPQTLEKNLQRREGQGMLSLDVSHDFPQLSKALQDERGKALLAPGMILHFIIMFACTDVCIYQPKSHTSCPGTLTYYAAFKSDKTSSQAQRQTQLLLLRMDHTAVDEKTSCPSPPSPNHLPCSRPLSSFHLLLLYQRVCPPPVFP